MCGIVGYTGSKQALPVLIGGLSRLEYRGYDSAGVAIWGEGKLKIEKAVGKLDNLKQQLKGRKIPGTLGIGHTRWATHGGVTKANAHPHTSQHGKLALIHNGIIENYQELRAELEKKGNKFRSQTDTEVLAHQIEAEYESLEQVGSENPDGLEAILSGRSVLLEATRRALQKVEGGYAIVVMHQDHPDLLVVARQHNPLIIGMGEGENLVASDVPALLDYTRKVCDLDNGELASLTPTDVKLYGLNGQRHRLNTRRIEWDAAVAEKGGYPHFLIKEIHETPRVMREVLSGRIRQEKVVGKALGLDGIDFSNITKITLLGCGSAAYACYLGKYLIERWGGITVEVAFGSEYRYHAPVVDGNTLVIALSQSGETADTLASIARAKQGNPARVIGIINALGSSMTREVDAVCPLQAGPEISVASTKAFSSMALTLSLMALYIGQERQHLSQEEIAAFLKELQTMPTLAEKVLKIEDEIARLSVHYIHHQSAYYIGRDVNYPSAMEGTQKLKELSYIHAEAYPAGELKHGPNAVIEPGFPVICLVPEGEVYKKMLSNIQEMKARGASILAFATEGDKLIAEHAEHVISLPKTSQELSVLVNTIAMQLFAYYVTLYKGYSIDHPRRLKKFYPKPGQKITAPKSIDIDKPRNLAKSVTVE